jgi:hypothetical protein
MRGLTGPHLPRGMRELVLWACSNNGFVEPDGLEAVPTYRAEYRKKRGVMIVQRTAEYGLPCL